MRQLYIPLVLAVLLVGVLLPTRIGATALPVPPKPTATVPQLGPGAHPTVPPGYTLIEGDILVKDSFVKEHQLHPQAAWTASFWANGVVPYEFDANVQAVSRTLMLQAMADWQNVAAVSFVARNGQADYIHVQASSGNNAAIGRQGGEQFVNIYNWNIEFKMAHELGHTLGFWHEQTRPDRDSYVTINTGNIQSGKEHDFDMHSDAGVYGPYDFDSVMQYDQCAFSTGSNCPTKGGETITVLKPNEAWQSKIGQRDHLSYLDRTTMSFLYPQANWRFVDANRSAGSGTFFSPWNTWATAIGGTPTGGTLQIQPGSYSAVGTYNRAMTLRAPLGGVRLGQ